MVFRPRRVADAVDHFLRRCARPIALSMLRGDSTSVLPVLPVRRRNWLLVQRTYTRIPYESWRPPPVRVSHRAYEQSAGPLVETDFVRDCQGLLAIVPKARSSLQT